MRGAAWVLGGMLAAGGCRGSEACADLGDVVLMSAQVTDNGEQTRVEVELRRSELGGASIPVKLCEDDALWVDAVEMTMVKRPTGAVVYEATLAADGEATRRFALHSDDEVSEFVARNARGKQGAQLFKGLGIFGHRATIALRDDALPMIFGRGA
ncbi:MAG TPA: hypothetical protein PLF40_16450 [Kofleriaceae bacterium]|mgnify:CR=1 FL=1|nr:hypothetical protein [Kofleriaceae bacterium]